MKKPHQISKFAVWRTVFHAVPDKRVVSDESVVRNKLVLVNSVESPVSQVFVHHHRLVVAVKGRNGKRLVGTQVHHGGRMAGRHDHIGIGHASQTFNYTASDRFFFVDNHHLEAVSEGTTLESYLHSMIRTT